MDDGSARDSVLRAEDRRYAAMTAMDGAVLGELLDGDLIYIHSGGVVDGKQGYIESVTSGFVDYDEIEHPVDKMIVIGDVVIVHGRMFAPVRVGGEPRDLASAVVAVWRTDSASPRLVSLQATSLPAA